MRPDGDDVLTALELIGSRVPDRHITPDHAMALSWLPDLVRFDRAAVFRAAREWGGLRFPASSEFLQACRDATATILAEEQAKYSAGELEIVDCPEGCSHGWLEGPPIEWAGDTYRTTRPCERCRPIEYAIWRHSIARPDHDPHRCIDCLAIKANKDPAPEWMATAREAAAHGPRRAEPTF